LFKAIMARLDREFFPNGYGRQKSDR
jgi:hypothetical protein